MLTGICQFCDIGVWVFVRSIAPLRAKPQLPPHSYIHPYKLDSLALQLYDGTMGIKPEDLRLAMRRWSTGVTVVTTQLDGVPYGMTVSSFTSVCLEPPLVLISLERISRTREKIVQYGFFGVTILTGRQQDLSERFARHTPGEEDRFTGLKLHYLTSGVPFLDGGLAFLECKVYTLYEASTHTVVYGEVIAVEAGNPIVTGEHPLIYYDRSYHQLD